MRASAVPGQRVKREPSASVERLAGRSGLKSLSLGSRRLLSCGWKVCVVVCREVLMRLTKRHSGSSVGDSASKQVAEALAVLLAIRAWLPNWLNGVQILEVKS